MKLKLLTSMLTVTLITVMSAATQHSNAQDTPRRIEIVAKRYGFTPGDITLKKGVPVVLVLTSNDVDHGLKFNNLGVNLQAKKGKSAEAAFTPTQTGNFVGECSVFCGSGHGSMRMTLHVTE